MSRIASPLLHCHWRQSKHAVPAMKPAAPGKPSAKGNGSFSAKQRHAKKRIAVAADALSTAANVEVPDVPKDDATSELIGAPDGPCAGCHGARWGG